MTLGEKIKRLRNDNNLTQEELASKIFVTRNAISKWETDRGIPNIESLKSIAKEFDLSLDYLLGDEEIFTIAMDNKSNIELTKNLAYSFGVFITFTLIGIIIPFASINWDPTSVMGVFILLLPISYILLGIFSMLIDIKWPFVIISSALAVTPIYVFFDLAIPNVIVGYWGIIYYVIYIFSYYISKKLATFLRQRKNTEKLKKIFFVLTIGLILTYVLHTAIEAISLYNCIACSAPWHTALIVNTLFYVIPISLLLVLYLYFYNKSKNI